MLVPGGGAKMSRQVGFPSKFNGSRLIPVLLALALAGCNQITAQPAAPVRPVLAATVQRDEANGTTDEGRARFYRSELSVELTKISLSYGSLLAHARCVVTVSLIWPGQVVAGGQPAFRVARRAYKVVVVAIPEALL